MLYRYLYWKRPKEYDNTLYILHFTLQQMLGDHMQWLGSSTLVPQLKIEPMLICATNCSEDL